MIRNFTCWPKNLADVLNKHWVMSPTSEAIISRDIFRTVFHESNKSARLISETLDYINGCSKFLQARDKYTDDDVEKVLSMLDEIGGIFIASKKIKRKKEILDCTKGYEV